MPKKDLTNLPILDDIILPGDANKAVHDTSSKVQSSLRQADAIAATASSSKQREAVTKSQSQDSDIPVQATAARSAAPAARQDDTQPPPGRPDIDALTEAIMASIMPDMQQLIRTKIRQMLLRHLPDQSGSE